MTHKFTYVHRFAKYRYFFKVNYLINLETKIYVFYSFYSAKKCRVIISTNRNVNYYDF